MRFPFLKTIILLFILVIAAQFADRYFFDRKLSHSGSAVIEKPFSYVFARLENARFFIKGLFKAGSLVAENENLRKENAELLSRLADYEDKKKENIFLKTTLGIAPRFSGRIAYADIYQFQLGPAGYDVLLNRGADDGLSEGNIIITEEGILVGIVKKVFENFSRALAVNDPNLSIAAKVLNSGTAGIAKGALAQGMFLDMVVQNDSIKEGDTVVSSGIDLVPPALIIGTVSHVETSGTDLFKKVKIRPAMGETKIGRVLIISR